MVYSGWNISFNIAYVICPASSGAYYQQESGNLKYNFTYHTYPLQNCIAMNNMSAHPPNSICTMYMYV